jgi:hypothetical protein
MKNRCAVLILRRKGDAYRFEACGAVAVYILIIKNDHLFAVCSRHDGRLDRAIGLKKEEA